MLWDQSRARRAFVLIEPGRQRCSTVPACQRVCQGRPGYVGCVGWLEILIWIANVGGVDDRQNCDRDAVEDGRRLVPFEAQRPIVALPAGVVGYDVTIRSSVGRRCSGASKVSSLCRPGLTCAAIDNRVGISVHRIVCSNSTQMLRSEVC